MPRIYYEASNYLGNYANINTLNEEFILCKKLDLYRAIVTVGNPAFLTWRKIKEFGLFRAVSDSVFQKCLLVQANIQSDLNGMMLHPIFNTYVSDEKRKVSYNLGMAVAKLYSERLLNIPNLIHIETLKKQQAVTFNAVGKKSKEPDLVGQTPDLRWHIFEAKGMSNNQLAKKIQEGKDQAREVATIHNVAPSTLSVCATHFGLDRITSKIDDPAQDGDKIIEIDVNKYFNTYYLPFLSLEETVQTSFKNQKIENIDYNYINIQTPKLNITIGLLSEVYELLKQGDWNDLNQYYINNIERNTFLNQEISENNSVGLDGFLFRYTNF